MDDESRLGCLSLASVTEGDSNGAQTPVCLDVGPKMKKEVGSSFDLRFSRRSLLDGR